MSYFKRILNNCNEASMLALKSKEEKLSPRQKFGMKFHLTFCKCCQNFEKQSELIDKSLKAYFKETHGKEQPKASEDFKNKLKDMIK